MTPPLFHPNFGGVAVGPDRDVGDLGSVWAGNNDFIIFILIYHNDFIIFILIYHKIVAYNKQKNLN